MYQRRSSSRRPAKSGAKTHKLECVDTERSIVPSRAMAETPEEEKAAAAAAATATAAVRLVIIIIVVVVVVVVVVILVGAVVVGGRDNGVDSIQGRITQGHVRWYHRAGALIRAVDVIRGRVRRCGDCGGVGGGGGCRVLVRGRAYVGGPRGIDSADDVEG